MRGKIISHSEIILVFDSQKAVLNLLKKCIDYSFDIHLIV